ncbi:Uma2 family endonuclease [Phormidium sp. FACHB-1136]|uniref:Uma2 family endonuclease n=1 Tax=Phormidium sp. FACHB-1136 TaxID=2692848 RepID=UPI001681E968|nr:Uma2 family endonuclease [Phormidium sp. FACHB-1136]MBD2429293.1 Uma2 family endonuclease [Phormidium sp. FACHB-1136]
MLATVAVHLPKTLRVSEDQFGAIVQANPDLRLELTATGELIAMSPTGSESGSYNSELTADVAIWNRRTKLGKVFDSSSGFRLPNGAIRSPDVAWVALERWAALSPDQRQGFAPLCPDFVIELRSATDDVATLQNKMQEYIDNGCRLGWLVNPKTRTVEVYRPDAAPETVPFTATLSGESVLPGFELNLHSLLP